MFLFGKVSKAALMQFWQFGLLWLEVHEFGLVELRAS